MKDFNIKRVHGIMVCLILALVLGVFLLYYDRVTPAGQDPSQGGQNESASLDSLTVTAQKIVMEGRTQVSNTPVQVTFSGSYHHKPLAEKDRWFSGSIRIEGIPETEWEMRRHILFIKQCITVIITVFNFFIFCTYMKECGIFFIAVCNCKGQLSAEISITAEKISKCIATLKTAVE